MNSIDDLIASFFKDPNKNLGVTGQFSVLYLLRRDILTCFGMNPDNNEPIGFRALWPGTMGVLAGIDLLGKFFSGEDSIGNVRNRFCEFIKQNFDSVSPPDEKIIYQLRNSMLHSFGLYSRGRKCEFRFSLTHAGRNPLVTRIGGDNYHIDTLTLYMDFEKGVHNYKNHLMTRTDLQSKFRSMIDNYGFVQMQ
ncbi:MAG TPA: hypothetical protein VMT62_02915 [Syntrophorhabdaceae bacterium]|nr:hypothetical protein [Syntrophorhabdaceae bacterium]